MKRLTMLLVLSLLAVAPVRAQDLSGSYVYHPVEGGVVTLELQHVGAQVTGVMTGMDGSINRLSGTFDGSAASGSIRTQTGTGWFGAGASQGGVTLVVAPLDPTTGGPDLDNGWRLDFTRAGGAQAGAPQAGVPQAGAGKSAGAPQAAPVPSPSRPAPAQPQASTSSPLAREWQQHLSGKKVTYLDSYSSDDGSGGYSNRWEAFLCSDGSFHFRSRDRMSVDAGGAFGSSNSSDSFSGTWRIIEQSGQAILQYQRSEQAGTDQGEWVALGYQNGETYFDGTRVYVTADNDMCR